MPAKHKNTANEYYKLAIQQYGEAKYDEAISSFDKAMSLGDRSLAVLDGKAAAMNKLGGTWRDSAYELAEKMCCSFERDKFVYKVGLLVTRLDCTVLAPLRTRVSWQRPVGTDLGLL